MSSLRWVLSFVAAFVMLALSGASGASADIVAAVDVPVATGSGAGTQSADQFDLALLNATTGARLPLPSGVNTASADEFHPSITPDGRWLAFQRVEPVGGTHRIIVVNLTTGQQADLFSAFEVSQQNPTTPFVVPDGSQVITGGPFAPAMNGRFNAQWGETSLANFPSGPFPHTTKLGIGSFGGSGQTLDPIERTGVAFASTLFAGSQFGQLYVESPNAGTTRLALRHDGPCPFGIGHPALSDPTTNVLVYEVRLPGGACTPAAQGPMRAFLVFTQENGFGQRANLPPLINAPRLDEAFPAFTPDGRYLAFVRQTANNHDRLFVFDPVTQTMLNNQGVDLGLVRAPASGRDIARRLEGNLSLREVFVFTRPPRLSSAGALFFQLLRQSGVGLLVQRIVGHHRLFGHRVPVVRVIGRVPFGLFARGRHHVHWNLRVNGRRLSPGTYMVTPRAVTSSGIVRELGTPRVLRIN